MLHWTKPSLPTVHSILCGPLDQGGLKMGWLTITQEGLQTFRQPSSLGGHLLTTVLLCPAPALPHAPMHRRPSMWQIWMQRLLLWLGCLVVHGDMKESQVWDSPCISCRQIDCEQSCSNINCRTFCPRRPLSAALADSGLCGRNILQSVVNWYCYVMLTINSLSLKSIAMSLYNIIASLSYLKDELDQLAVFGLVVLRVASIPSLQTQAGHSSNW